MARLKWGVVRGACVGAAFSAFVALKALFYGSEMVATYHVSITVLVGLYIAGGVVGGGVIGLAKPLMRFAPGIILISVVAATPLAVGFRVAMYGFAPWTPGDYIGVFMGALVMSIIPAGLMLDDTSVRSKLENKGDANTRR